MNAQGAAAQVARWTDVVGRLDQSPGTALSGCRVGPRGLLVTVISDDERPNMRIGVPKEIKTLEFRIGATPGVVQRLVHEGNEVVVETGAGAGTSAPIIC
jgi:Alanine dehydrogenase/PNT, N-terminal domain